MDAMTTPLEFFPKPTPREKQEVALKFVGEAVRRGFKHIVIAAPTGIGKSAIGVACCAWAAAPENAELLKGEAGGYYLITQKLLQDQLAGDFVTEPFIAASLKSATEYECPVAPNCAASAAKKKNPCKLRKEGGCAYNLAKAQFLAAHTSVTNYPFFLTERAYVKKFPQRKVLVLDECHTLERQILRFIDLAVSEESLEQWAVETRKVPVLSTLPEFATWVDKVYLPEMVSALEGLIILADTESGAMTNDEARKIVAMDTQISKCAAALKLIKTDPANWVYWQEKDKNEKLVSIARPLNAAPFANTLFDGGDIKIHMSAFPGDKEVYCRSLGLNTTDVAWASLTSTFPIDNRPIVIGSVGSMSMRNVERTLPAFLLTVERILTRHTAEKGIIHCNSYKLGTAIMDAFKDKPWVGRLLFPKSADEREEHYTKHRESPEPTVLVSPSVTEGFDFMGDAARWQIIAKVPYPSLGDKQVAAKMKRDRDWYQCETIKTIIQASGRVVRSDDDRGVTYILDSDFDRLYEENKHFFPRWFTSAFVYPRRQAPPKTTA